LTEDSVGLFGSADTGEVDSASRQEVLLPGPAVKATGFFRRELCDVLKASFCKPAAELIRGMVVLIDGGIPVERITNSVLPRRVSAEADELIEDLIENGDSP
jgi:hypothetical protein